MGQPNSHHLQAALSLSCIIVHSGDVDGVRNDREGDEGVECARSGRGMREERRGVTGFQEETGRHRRRGVHECMNDNVVNPRRTHRKKWKIRGRQGQGGDGVGVSQ